MPSEGRRPRHMSTLWPHVPRSEWESRIVLAVCARVQVCACCGASCLMLLLDVLWCSRFCQDLGFFAARVPATVVVPGSRLSPPSCPPLSAGYYVRAAPGSLS